MRHLLLLRHAKASWDDPGMPDHGRPINPRGRQTAQAMRDEFGRRGIGADLGLVSSARRTLQTLQSLAPVIVPEVVEPMDALYLAPAIEMLEVLRKVTPTLRRVLLVGHNPGLHDLALNLAADLSRSDAPGAAVLAEAFPTMSLARLEVDGEWVDLGAGGARLEMFLTPADLGLSAGGYS